jgi:hypothetical protein
MRTQGAVAALPAGEHPAGPLESTPKLVVTGVVSPFGPAPGSIEGLIYSKLPVGSLWGGLLEVVLQSLLLSTLLPYTGR